MFNKCMDEFRSIRKLQISKLSKFNQTLANLAPHEYQERGGRPPPSEAITQLITAQRDLQAYKHAI